MSLCLLCGSRKPAPGLQTPSASREMLKEIQLGVRAAKVPSTFVDLREYELPFWDGREAAGYGSPELDRLRAELVQASGFVWSIPAYWNSLSGVMKNLVDLVGEEPFRGKLIGLLVVGMDEPSAWHGAAQARRMIASLGAWCPPEQMVIGNPRKVTDLDALRKELRSFGAYMGLLMSGRAQPFRTLTTQSVPAGVDN